VSSPRPRRPVWLPEDAPPEAFPPVDQALEDPDGLLAIGGDLSLPRLLAAYRRGIFPWPMRDQPMLWWSPNPREVLFPERFHCSRSLGKRLARGEFRFTRNQCFGAVIRACGAPRAYASGTWIEPAMVEAYEALHAAGHAHSWETWQGDQLVGGLYGVRVGQVFCGESMFSRSTDASKAAMATLVADCPALGIRLIDCQLATPHLRSLGSQPMPRAQYLEWLPGLH
jgi:leucyl/phenylalanyl-tRNA---protein transferase